MGIVQIVQIVQIPTVGVLIIVVFRFEGVITQDLSTVGRFEEVVSDEARIG